MKYILSLVALVFFSTAVYSTNYYINSTGGNPGNNGTSPATPFLDVSQLEKVEVRPGDSVLFAAGTAYTGGFAIDFSGTSRFPVVISSYGPGPRPILTNPGEHFIIRVDGDYITISNLELTETHYSGIHIRGSHCEVKQCEIHHTGFGIQVKGNVVSIHDNHIRDLHIIRNTKGGDDDYGAAGILVGADTVWIYENIIENCIDDSYDYGVDGGILEFYGDINHVRVYRNIGRDSDGFFEVGGGTIKDIEIFYNLMVNNGEIGGFHLKGNFKANLEDFSIVNNTVYEDVEEEWQVLWFNGTEGAEEVSLVNNIICYKGFSGVSNFDSFNHRNNLYFPMDETPFGELNLRKSEMKADPLFVDEAGGDFRLKAGSPAIDAGKVMKYHEDFYRMPITGEPDLGAFEYVQK